MPYARLDPLTKAFYKQSLPLILHLWEGPHSRILVRLGPYKLLYPM